MQDKNKIISDLRALGFDVSFYGQSCVLRRYTGKDIDVTLPDIIDEIGDCAFYDNKLLRSVTFGKNIKIISTSAFEDCSALEWVSPLEGVTEIRPYAFSYTIKLENITFSDNLTSIGEYAFCGSGIYEINIPDSVKRVSFKAFFACPRLHTAVTGGKNAVYEESSFANCMKLRSLTVSDGVSALERRAFSYCKILEDITLPEGIFLGEDAFEAVPAQAFPKADTGK